MRLHCWRDTRLAHALGFRCHTTELVRANLLAGFGPSYRHHRALVDRALAEMRAAQANNPYAAREKRAEDIVIGRPVDLPTGGIGAKPTFLLTRGTGVRGPGPSVVWIDEIKEIKEKP